MSNIDMERCCE